MLDRRWIRSRRTGAHVSVFLAALQTQASKEQLDEWMPWVINRGISGCYAQTELAHVRHRQLSDAP